MVFYQLPVSKAKGNNTTCVTQKQCDAYYMKDGKDIPGKDIESFQVFKDASETAIYGARGANGVVLITTKPVSYTHLDVYKRQVHMLENIPQGEAKMPHSINGKGNTSCRSIYWWTSGFFPGILWYINAVSYTHLDVYKRQNKRESHFP